MIAEEIGTGARPRGVVQTLAGVGIRLTVPLAIGALGLALLASLSIALLPLAGYHASVIAGGSMEPTIHAGALLVSQPAAPESLQVGDVITYLRPGAQASVTHRIVAEHDLNGQRAFTMQGDGNATPDPLDINFSTDTPRVLFSVPYAGFAMEFLHSPGGMLLFIASPAIGLAILFVLGMGKRPEAEEAATA